MGRKGNWRKARPAVTTVSLAAKVQSPGYYDREKLGPACGGCHDKEGVRLCTDCGKGLPPEAHQRMHPYDYEKKDT